jgi:hemoglobin-like flavoprotein
MTPQLDISILETSFDLIAPRREELVDRFYRTLFSKAPSTRALFVQADMRAQTFMALTGRPWMDANRRLR